LTLRHWAVAIGHMERAIIATTLALLGGCSETCSNTAVTTVNAPDGKHQVELFQRDCGATTGFSTQVSISEPGDEGAARGNAFVADDNHGAAVAAAWGGPWVNVKWTSPKALLVQFDAKSRVFKQVAEVKGVRVTYEPVPH